MFRWEAISSTARPSSPLRVWAGQHWHLELEDAKIYRWALVKTSAKVAQFLLPYPVLDAPGDGEE